jgi:hypothetical protein
MKHTTLTRSLFVAGAVALAGAAQAGGSGHVSSSDLSTPVAESSTVDTTTMGAGPSTMPSASSTTTVTTQYVYVQPSIDWDRGAVVTQMRSNPHLVHGNRTQAAATFNVPARAGEASTMTGGAPNAVTSNDRVIVGSYVIPHATVTTSPYYVFSY